MSCVHEAGASALVTCRDGFIACLSFTDFRIDFDVALIEVITSTAPSLHVGIVALNINFTTIIDLTLLFSTSSSIFPETDPGIFGI